MTVTASPRLGLTRWSADGDFQNRSQFDADNAALDSLVAISGNGLRAGRPAPGVVDRYFYATDTHELFYDDGAAWNLIATTLVHQAWHVGGLLTAGVKAPKWSLPRAARLTLAQGICDAGSGATWRLRVNGATPTGMTTSTATGLTVVTNDFPDVTLATGDYVQVEVVAAGTSAYDLTITATAFWI